MDSKNKTSSPNSIKNRVNLFEEASSKPPPRLAKNPSRLKKSWGNLQDSKPSEPGSSETVAPKSNSESPTQAARNDNDLELDLTTEETQDLFGQSAPSTNIDAPSGPSYSPTLANTPQFPTLAPSTDIVALKTANEEPEKASADTIELDSAPHESTINNDTGSKEFLIHKSSGSQGELELTELDVGPSFLNELEGAFMLKETSKDTKQPESPSMTSTEDELDSRTEVALNPMVESVLNLSIGFDPMPSGDLHSKEAGEPIKALDGLAQQTNQVGGLASDSHQGSIDLSDAMPIIPAEPDLARSSGSSKSGSMYDVALASSIREASDSDSLMEPITSSDFPVSENVTSQKIHQPPEELGSSQSLAALNTYSAENNENDDFIDQRPIEEHGLNESHEPITALEFSTHANESSISKVSPTASLKDLSEMEHPEESLDQAIAVSPKKQMDDVDHVSSQEESSVHHDKEISALEETQQDPGDETLTSEKIEMSSDKVANASGQNIQDKRDEPTEDPPSQEQVDYADAPNQESSYPSATEYELDSPTYNPPVSDKLNSALDDHISEPSFSKDTELGLETSDPIDAKHGSVTEDPPAPDALPLTLEDHISEPSSPKEAEPSLETPPEVGSNQCWA
ncbi:hypothetical protein DSO57_1013240 [Entomophthora muscae]|uniref:Uncharacterized protein n=1 Tax=Entomophthora muscae TaxID=34485 RepID=A0ACC2SIH7_9FUNG|nr:hypothetical protein DSO57_1013240 [Entomophthora muscae]